MAPLLSALVLVACGGEDGTDTTASSSSTGAAGGTTAGTGGAGGSGPAASTSTGGGGSEAITLTFAAEVGGQPFACGTSFDGLGASKSKAELLDFRLYVHDVRLLDGKDEVPVTLEQDGVWQLEKLALLDFEDKKGKCANGTTEKNLTVRGTIPAGVKYDGVRFKLGVPFELNHSDASTAPSPLNLSGLFWNWQGGRKFLRIDAMAEGAMKAFNLHVGSTGCDGDPASGGVTACTSPNVATIELAGFDAAKNTIVVDYAAMVAAVDFAKPDGGGASGCMGGKTDPECAQIFDKLGIDIATGSPKVGAQTAFKVK
ncbi:MAG: metallo-mystery pair system four-Cys motif protein [Deltaproteobacteria bacterium]|nr:metallo-mystery pair system four-Cys motif protein [Deltaproteobacteria bacterium]